MPPALPVNFTNPPPSCTRFASAMVRLRVPPCTSTVIDAALSAAENSTHQFPAAHSLVPSCGSQPHVLQGPRSPPQPSGPHVLAFGTHAEEAHSATGVACR